MRFVPVPCEAFEVVEAQDYGAVADLYRRAHQLRWKPFSVTERSLATRWGCSGRRVWLILDALAMQDLLTVERGSRRKPSRITMVEPAMHKGQQKRQHKSQGSKGHMGRREAQGEAQGDETLGETLDLDLRPDPPTSPRAGGIDRLVKRMLAALQQGQEDGFDPDSHQDVMDMAGWCKTNGYPAGTRRVEQAMRIALAKYRGEA